jgi:integrase
LTTRAAKLLKEAELPFKISKWQVSKQFRKLCIGYGIKGAVFHDCRRNALTNFMKDKGLNVPETMKIAGHTDPRMLLRIYNNLEAHHVAKKLNG